MNIDKAIEIVERHGLDHIPDQGSHWIDLAEHLEKYELLLEALQKYEAAFHKLFAQVAGNPVSNAWGEPIDFTLLNHAHRDAGPAIAKAEGKQ